MQLFDFYTSVKGKDLWFLVKLTLVMTRSAISLLLIDTWSSSVIFQILSVPLLHNLPSSGDFICN